MIGQEILFEFGDIWVFACYKVGGELMLPERSGVVNGTSETMIATRIAGLKAALPLAINVHKSASELKVYTACGDLK